MVKRRVVTTTQQQLTTEKVRLEPDDDWDNDSGADRPVDMDDVNQQAVFDNSQQGQYQSVSLSRLS